jgi:ABC-type Fe3+/spermidine/putrescine transport system ATPase subunit
MNREAGSLSLAGISHAYGDTTVLDDVSLDIAEGEFLTLLGPSGCGKTTLLRIIAGFVSPTAGQVRLNDRDITTLPPHKRPLNMVFQRPTLFPHLNVFDNVAFGLRIAKLSKRDVAIRVKEALELVRLPAMERRRAGELSGGQMQRVALARALANRPRVLLLDEPLSALDLKIRLEMEVELRRVHRETGATFVYVTHDQREALALSDRVAVFAAGRVEQVAAPDVLYARPATPFAARFVGDANVVAVRVVRNAGTADLFAGEHRIQAGYDGAVEGDGWLVLRPEALRFGVPGSEPGVSGVVKDVAYRGTAFTYRINVADLGDTELKAEMSVDAGPAMDVGSAVTLTWNPRASWMLARGAQES